MSDNTSSINTENGHLDVTEMPQKCNKKYYTYCFGALQLLHMEGTDRQRLLSIYE